MKNRKKKRFSYGASAVEFALILPILLLILFGIIEYGWILTYQIVLTNAVSEGARAGVRSEDDDEARTYAIQAVQEAFWLQDLKKESVETEITDDESPKRIVVKVPGITYKTLTGFIPSNLIPKKIGAKAVMAFP